MAATTSAPPAAAEVSLAHDSQSDLGESPIWDERVGRLYHVVRSRAISNGLNWPRRAAARRSSPRRRLTLRRRNANMSLAGSESAL